MNLGYMDGGSGLNRDSVVEAALGLLASGGIEALSMRALADQLGVKAASLYWHVRDKDQLLELVAESVLDEVEVPLSGGWRDQASAACAALATTLQQHPGASRVLLGSMSAVRRSRLVRDLARALTLAGVEAGESVAFQLVVAVITEASLEPLPVATAGGERKTLDIDSGSWRVNVRAAASDAVDVATSVGGGGAAWVDVRPDGHVLVRNRRGGNRGAVELSPRHTWAIKVHGGTWNSFLDLTGLSVSSVELDSGAGNVTCTLPAPAGVVPVRINSGIVGVQLHRPRNAAARATISSGSVKVRFDGEPVRVAAADSHWSTPGGAQAEDRFEVAVYSGCVKVSMDADAPAAEPLRPAAAVTATAPSEPVSAAPLRNEGVELILDGVASKLQRTSS